MIEYDAPPRKVAAGSGRRTPWPLLWLVALGGVAAVGLGGRIGEHEATSTEVAAATEAPARRPNQTAGPTIQVTTPGPDHPTIGGIAVSVRGRVSKAVDRLQVYVERDGERIAQQRIVAAPSGVFGAVLTLSAPRAAGPVDVVAVARDYRGIRLAEIRRAVEVTALAPASVSGRQLGEDGALGSRGVASRR